MAAAAAAAVELVTSGSRNESFLRGRSPASTVGVAFVKIDAGGAADGTAAAAAAADAADAAAAAAADAGAVEAEGVGVVAVGDAGGAADGQICRCFSIFMAHNFRSNRSHANVQNSTHSSFSLVRMFTTKKKSTTKK